LLHRGRPCLTRPVAQLGNSPLTPPAPPARPGVRVGPVRRKRPRALALPARPAAPRWPRHAAAGHPPEALCLLMRAPPSGTAGEASANRRAEDPPQGGAASLPTSSRRLRLALNQATTPSISVAPTPPTPRSCFLYSAPPHRPLSRCHSSPLLSALLIRPRTLGTTEHHPETFAALSGTPSPLPLGTPSVDRPPARRQPGRGAAADRP
jgi:hypothetical protein